MLGVAVGALVVVVVMAAELFVSRALSRRRRRAAASRSAVPAGWVGAPPAVRPQRLAPSGRRGGSDQLDEAFPFVLLTGTGIDVDATAEAPAASGVIDLREAAPAIPPQPVQSQAAVPQPAAAAVTSAVTSARTAG